MTTQTIQHKMEKEIANRIEEYNSVCKELNAQFGDLVEPKTYHVHWDRVYKAMQADRINDLIKIGFTEDDLETAKAYSRLQENGCITDTGDIDVENGVKRGLSGELEQIGVSVDLINDWQLELGEY